MEITQQNHNLLTFGKRRAEDGDQASYEQRVYSRLGFGLQALSVLDGVMETRHLRQQLLALVAPLLFCKLRTAAAKTALIWGCIHRLSLMVT